MRVPYWLTALGMVWVVNSCASIQSVATPDAEMRQIEIVWREFWEHRLHDYQAASQYVHSEYGKKLPCYSPKKIEERKLLVLFMLNCRPEPPVNQFPLGEVRFRLRCKQLGNSKEIVDEHDRLRRNTDGKLKFTNLQSEMFHAPLWNRLVPMLIGCSFYDNFM